MLQGSSAMELALRMIVLDRKEKMCKGWSEIRGFAAQVARRRWNFPLSPKARDQGHPQFLFPGLRIETRGTRFW
jgi:hypothetical protein